MEVLHFNKYTTHISGTRSTYKISDLGGEIIEGMTTSSVSYLGDSPRK